MPVINVDKIVEIAADFPGRFQIGKYIDLSQLDNLRIIGRQQIHLDFCRYTQLAIYTFLGYRSRLFAFNMAIYRADHFLQGIAQTAYFVIAGKRRNFNRIIS